MPLRNVDITFGGARLLLDARGALYWPQHGVLVVSDLHLEKSTYLAQHGSLVAPYDTQDTLERLAALVAFYQPRELMMLGDSFHDSGAWNRLDAALRERIEALCGQVAQCSWIEGNHDLGLLQEGLAFVPSREVGGISFFHEREEGETPQIIGHYHPKISLRVKGRKLSGRCFVVTPQLLVMPAFGSYTGGLDIGHDAFHTLFQEQPRQYYLLYGESIHALR